MDVSFVDLMIAMVPLGGLIVLMRYREMICKADSSSYRQMAGGTTVLTIVSVLTLLRDYGAFTNAPFIGHPLASELIIWIGAISGSVILVSGVSQYLPIAREYRRIAGGRVQRLELIKQIEQLLAVEERPRVILSRSLEMIVESYEARHGAVMVYNQSQSSFRLLSMAGEESDTVNWPEGLSLSDEELDAWLNEPSKARSRNIARVCEQLDCNCRILPLRTSERLYGAILLWFESKIDAVAEESLDLLSITVDIICRKILLDRHRMAVELRDRRNKWKKTVSSLVDYRKDLPWNLKRLGPELLKGLNADLLTLVVSGDRRIAQRYTLGQGGQLLHEIGIDLAKLSRHVGDLFAAGEAILIDDISVLPAHQLEPALLESDTRSLMAVGIDRADKVVAAITVGSRQASRFSAREQNALKMVVATIGNLVVEDLHRASLAEQYEGLSRLSSLLEEANAGTSRRGLAQSVTDCLAGAIRSTIIRISFFESEGTFLKSVSMHTSHEVEVNTPPAGHMVMSLMPYHQLLRDTGRVMLINQQETEKRLALPEVRQAFCPGVKSALLVPIKRGGEVIGVISLADVRSWGRYQYRDEDILLVRVYAALLGTAPLTQVGGRLAESANRLASLDESKKVVAAFDPWSEMRSSLTGILGSVEMMSADDSMDDRSRARYLSIINRSARRIESYVDAGTDTRENANMATIE